MMTPIRYDQCLSARGFTPEVRGIWATVGRTTAEYGWKLHLSSVGHDAERLLESVASVLTGAACPFKVARDSEILGMLNEGAFGATQVGKFATIYPETGARALELARELIRVTDGAAGPRVVTDLFLGGAVYARYGSHSPRYVRDRLGLFDAANRELQADYSVPFVAPDAIPNPFSEFEANQPRTSHSPAPIGPGYLISGVIQAHAKGSVFEALDLRRQEAVARVVLKEGRRHCMSDMHGRDVRDRLRHQFAAHEALKGRVPIPFVYPPFEHAGNLYLPLEYIPGQDFGSRQASPFAALSDAGRRTLLEQLRQIAQALGLLHAEGYVHRDLTVRNVRFTPDQRVVLLDLEICHRVDAETTIPFSQGTAGFVSPQQLADLPPSFADDVFSLGAIIICGMTGCDPQRVLHGRRSERVEQLRVLAGAPEWLCRLAAACVSENAASRPSVADVERALADGINAAEAELGVGFPTVPSDHGRVIEAGLRWLIQSAHRDDAALWLSPDLASSTHGSLKLVHGFRVYRSASRGVAGVLYTLSKLHRLGYVTPGAAEGAGATVDWLLAHQDTPDDQMVGLHFGEAGVAVAIAEAVAAKLIARGPWLLPYMSEALAGPIDWPDLSHGAAGQGMAAFLCGDLLKQPELCLLANPCAEYLVAAQRDDGSWVLPKGVRAMEGSTYSGFAHGTAGMVAFLAVHARRTGSEQSRAAALLGGEWLIGQARTGRAAASLWWTMNTETDETWNWWCHGAPGIALALLALFEATHDTRWSGAARACLRGHPLDLRYPNLSQCHGMSGLGEILLEAFDVLREREWFDRAQAIGATMVNLASDSNDGSSWLVENPYWPTADLMIGCSGVVHFLARLASCHDRTFGGPLMPTSGRT